MSPPRGAPPRVTFNRRCLETQKSKEGSISLPAKHYPNWTWQQMMLSAVSFSNLFKSHRKIIITLDTLVMNLRNSREKNSYTTYCISTKNYRHQYYNRLIAQQKKVEYPLQGTVWSHHPYSQPFPIPSTTTEQTQQTPCYPELYHPECSINRHLQYKSSFAYLEKKFDSHPVSCRALITEGSFTGASRRCRVAVQAQVCTHRTVLPYTVL